MELLGMSLVTNFAAGIQTTPLSHEEVLATGAEAQGRIGALLASIVSKL
jgi:purine-nucleoside phosphorylase